MTERGFDTSAWIDVFKRLNLELPPVAVSFSIRPPDGVEQLKGSAAVCEMLKKAQEGNALYVSPENHSCGGGLIMLGKSVQSVYLSGEYGAGLGGVNHFRAMRRIYEALPSINPLSKIDYMAFSPLEKLAFEPDLLVIVADIEQAEILLRSMSYSTGKVFVSKCTSYVGCAWTYAYPYMTGELNYVTAGIGQGMKRRKLVPPGRQVISIPYDLFATMLYNLQTMPWLLPMLSPGAEEFGRKLRCELGLEGPARGK